MPRGDRGEQAQAEALNRTRSNVAHVVLAVLLACCTPIGAGPTGVLVDASPDATDVLVADSGSAKLQPCEQLAQDASSECFALCAGSDSTFPPAPGKCARLSCPLLDGTTWVFGVCADPLKGGD